MANTLYFVVFSVLVYFLIYIYKEKIGETLNVIDYPNEKRKIHNIPTPKTASFSLAIFFSIYFLTGLFVDLFEESFRGVLIGTISIFIVGFFDDRYKLSPVLKTFLISMIVLILCVTNEGLLIDRFYIKNLDFYFQLKNFSIIFTVLCVLCLVNSLNLSDGINGLATGIIFFWLIYINQIYQFGAGMIIIIVLINLIIMFVHIYRGDQFLGDAGSLMLSSFVSFLIIWLHNKNISHPSQGASAETIFIIFIIPVIDMLRLLFERLINKKNPAYGDNQHLHHYLVNKYKLNRALIFYFLFLNAPIITSLYTSINKIYIICAVIIIYSSFIYYYKRLTKK